MTSLGSTTSQLEPYIITDSKEIAKNRFLGNLEKNQYEVEYLATALEAKFEAQWMTLKLKTDTYEKTLAIVESLLKWDTITLDSWDKISIDVNRVFYLLGDCCNESLGVEITKINIQQFNEDITVKWKYSASGTPDKIYKGGVDLYYDNHHVTNRVVTQEIKVSAKGSKNIKDIKNTLNGTTDTWVYKNQNL